MFLSLHKFVKYFQLRQISALKMFTVLTLIIRKASKLQLLSVIFLLFRL